MGLLDRETATARGVAFLTSGTSSPGIQLRALTDLAFVHDGKLVLPYDGVGFLDHGDIDRMLVGILPLLVDLADATCSYCTLEDVVRYDDLGLLD